MQAEALVLLAVLTLSPGPDTVLTLRQALTHGRAAAWWTVVGISSGTVVHSAVSGAGIAILVARSPGSYTFLVAAGAGVLAWFGARSLRSAWLGPAAAVDPAPDPAVRLLGFRDGLLTNLLNPKVLLFYLAFLPAFIGPGEPFLALSIGYGLWHASIGMAWLNLVASVAHGASSRIQGPAFARAVDGVAGVALVGLAARLAWTGFT